jgi:hypothetical protein
MNQGSSLLTMTQRVEVEQKTAVFFVVALALCAIVLGLGIRLVTK